jgi:predicted nucleotidyltransferase
VTRGLAEYVQQRDALLGRIDEVLRADPRVAAAWLTGSFGRGEEDAWSDFDLHVAVHDAHFESFWNERSQLYARLADPVLIQNEIPSNAQPGGHFQLVVFDGPLEVDWNVGPLSRARRPATHVLLFAREQVPLLSPPSVARERRAEECQPRLIFIWAMAPIVLKYVGRGATRRAVGLLGLMSDAFVILWRLLHELDTPEPTATGLNRRLEPELAALLPNLGRTIEPLDCLQAVLQLCQETERLHQPLLVLGVAIPERMPAQVARLAQLAEEALQA